MERADDDPRSETTAAELERDVLWHLRHSRGSAVQSASLHDLHVALCHAVRDRLVDRWRRTTENHWRENPRFRYYL